MPEKVRIDSTLCDGQAQAWDEKILELFPDVFDVELFDFHVQIQITRARVCARRREIWVA
jgi:hypothetical protein